MNNEKRAKILHFKDVFDTMDLLGKTENDFELMFVNSKFHHTCSYCCVVGGSSVIIEPRCEKTGLRGFRPGPTQTELYNHRPWLEA